MKKKIITNTVTFILLVLSINVLNFFFDTANSLVGVTIIIAAMMALGGKKSKTPGRDFLILVFINVSLGILSKLATFNVWLGIPINFISLALVGYGLSFTMSKMLVVPFGLEYLFMLYAPVSGVLYVKRILELIVGAVLVIFLQWLAHRNNKEAEKSEMFIFAKEPEHYREFTLFNKTFKVDTIRASYAIRIGVLTAITAFITGYFQLAEGRWMSYTVFSLTELYAENCKVRSKQRMQGTIIGAIIVLISFTIFKSNVWRTIILLLAGYLNPFANNYRDSMILVTVSAVAAIGLTNGGAIRPIIERLLFVGFGCLISLLANRFILYTPRKDES